MYACFFKRLLDFMLSLIAIICLSPSFSRSTMYKYVDLGVFSFRNIDLPRKVKYKKRKENRKQRIRRETAIRKGRTYEDFKNYIGEHPDCSIVEMDTVEGVKGGKVFLTLLIRKSKFMMTDSR